MKRYKTLDKKWKEIVYAMTGLGPNLLMVLMGAYFTDAINPAALPSGSLQASSFAVSGISLIMPAIFSVLWMCAKLFDGIIDIPMASITDNLKTKWGKRRPPIAICFLPMVISYALCWIPISQTNQLANTIWISILSFIFFTTYTMCLISFYGSLSTVCVDEKQRTRVSSYKAFFDTISYCLVYALVPLLIQILNVHIDKFVLMMLPMMLTMIIPLFMIKEGKKFEKKAIEEGYDIAPIESEKKVGIKESIKSTFTNKPFMSWCIVNCCAFFGLQLFLVSMNTLVLTGMGLTNSHMAIINTCAFAPVPVMLYLFNKIKNKKGMRFTIQLCLLSFAVCILTFFLGSSFLLGEGNIGLKLIIGALGGVFGSLGISSFFMVPYVIPSQIAAIEEKVTGKNITAMYFAANAVLTSITGSIAGALIYENIKMIFFEKGTLNFVWAENAMIAATKLGISSSNVYNLAVLIVPFIVSLFCVVGFLLAFRMPKNYSYNEVVKQLNIDQNSIVLEPEDNSVDKESTALNLCLYVLSGSIFGLIWRYTLIKEAKTYKNNKNNIINYIISILLLPYTGYVMYKVSKGIKTQYKTNKDYSILVLILGLIGLNIISYTILQQQINKASVTNNE